MRFVWNCRRSHTGRLPRCDFWRLRTHVVLRDRTHHLINIHIDDYMSVERLPLQATSDLRTVGQVRGDVDGIKS